MISTEKKKPYSGLNKFLVESDFHPILGTNSMFSARVSISSAIELEIVKYSEDSYEIFVLIEAENGFVCAENYECPYHIRTLASSLDEVNRILSQY